MLSFRIAITDPRSIKNTSLELHKEYEVAAMDDEHYHVVDERGQEVLVEIDHAVTRPAKKVMHG